MDRVQAVSVARWCVSRAIHLIELAQRYEEEIGAQLQVGVFPERRHLQLWEVEQKALREQLRQLSEWLLSGFANVVHLEFCTVVNGEVVTSYFEAAAVIAEMSLDTADAVAAWLRTIPASPWAPLEGDDDLRFEATVAIARLASMKAQALTVAAGLARECHQPDNATQQLLNACHVWNSDARLSWSDVAFRVQRVTLNSDKAKQFSKDVKRFAKKHSIDLRPGQSGRKKSP